MIYVTFINQLHLSLYVNLLYACVLVLSPAEFVFISIKMSENEPVGQNVPLSETSTNETEKEEPLITDSSLATDTSSVNTEPTTNKVGKNKIDILLKATGNAPIMKKKRWAVDPDKKISMIIDFMKKFIKLDPSENLFLYVNQAFAPAPDQVMKNLYECYGSDGKLVLHYCKSQAWG